MPKSPSTPVTDNPAGQLKPGQRFEPIVAGADRVPDLEFGVLQFRSTRVLQARQNAGMLQQLVIAATHEQAHAVLLHAG